MGGVNIISKCSCYPEGELLNVIRCCQVQPLALTDCAGAGLRTRVIEKNICKIVSLDLCEVNDVVLDDAAITGERSWRVELIYLVHRLRNVNNLGIIEGWVVVLLRGVTRTPNYQRVFLRPSV